MSASGTDHISGTSAKISRPSPGPTEWINVSVVYGPPEVEKKRTKTSPSVPIARGSFCLIDHASMTKRTKLNHAKSLAKSGTQETLSDSPEKCPKPQRVYFFLLPPRALRCCGKPDLRNIVSIVILCDLRVKVDTGG